MKDIYLVPALKELQAKIGEGTYVNYYMKELKERRSFYEAIEPKLNLESLCRVELDSLSYG